VKTDTTRPTLSVVAEAVTLEGLHMKLMVLDLNRSTTVLNTCERNYTEMKKRNNRYLIVMLSALALEIGSTMYISSVSDKDMANTMLWAFLGPFIALPFAGYVADEKTWRGRFLLALSSSVGYVIGAFVSMSLILKT